MFKNILVATDGSERSEKVIGDGAVLAKQLGARITGVHIIQLLYIGPSGGEFGLFDPTLQKRIEESARADGNRYLDRIESAATAAGVPFDRVLVKDVPPWKGIIDTAESKGCDLIMMAAHGRRPVAALVLGSETNKVLANSKIPVLVHR